ncbi:MAG: 1,2-diacylglycerol 3-beta-glucosyltransferase [Cellvibrionaceae bacterium]|jgi:1,2-diacylglycerol 3-beta-glucosyltransferase
MILIIQAILFALILVPFLMGVYLLVLTISAWAVTQRRSQSSVDDNKNFLFLIPAHNEEKLLPETLNNLLQEIVYSKSKYEVVVISDNSIDGTASVARKLGATVFERFNDELKGKGYALEWGLEKCWSLGKTPDAVVILDADTVVSKNFLQEMNASLQNGSKVIQAFYSVRNPDESWSAGLRYAALAVLHFVRPQGRSLYGGSAGLKGNGMVFDTDVIKNHRWSSSLTEDIEFHMDLLLSGEKVHFAPNAVVWAEMPNSIDDANSQNERWEAGRLEMAKKYVPQLFRSAFKADSIKNKQVIPQLDAIMEHVIPPFAIFSGISVLLFALALSAFLFDRSNWLASWNLLATLSLIIIQIFYLLSGLLLTKAPTSVYRQLLYAPFYILWKFLLIFRMTRKDSKDDWIRTTRNETQL